MISWRGSEAVIRTRLFAPTLRASLVAMTMLRPSRGSSIRPVLTEPHVTSSIWEEYLVSWDDESALRECRVPLLYIDAGTPNADLLRAVELCPGLMIARTIGSGHFSPLVVPEQVNAVLERFLRLHVANEMED